MLGEGFACEGEGLVVRDVVVIGEVDVVVLIVFAEKEVGGSWWVWGLL